MTAVGLIGCGGIAQDVLAALRASPANGVSVIGALARPGRGEAARAKLCEIDVVESLDDLLARSPALIAEVAGQSAVIEHGDAVLRSGVDCLVISVGALADPALLARLRSAAQDGNSRILLPAGAIGGIDAIAAMRVAGLTSVRYRSRKLRVGSLWINDASRFRLDTYPFGGVGASGFGREGVRYAMEELSQWKFTGMRLNP